MIYHFYLRFERLKINYYLRAVNAIPKNMMRFPSRITIILALFPDPLHYVKYFSNKIHEVSISINNCIFIYLITNRLKKIVSKKI